MLRVIVKAKPEVVEGVEVVIGTAIKVVESGVASKDRFIYKEKLFFNLIQKFLLNNLDLPCMQVTPAHS